MTADEWLAEVMTRLPREGDDEKRAFATKIFVRAFGEEIFTADPKRQTTSPQASPERQHK